MCTLMILYYSLPKARKEKVPSSSSISPPRPSCTTPLEPPEPPAPLEPASPFPASITLPTNHPTKYANAATAPPSINISVPAVYHF